MVQELREGHPPKLVLGLTGGIGTGKTTVAHMLEELGAYVVHADDIAHEVYMKDGPLYGRIRELFRGVDLENEKGIDRRKVASIVFRDAALLKKLEDIVHPYVRQRILDELADSDEGVVVLDVPLLFETGFDRFCDRTLVVSAPDKVADERLREKGFTQAEIDARRNVQLPLDAKIKRADIVIPNAGSLSETRDKTARIWKDLRPVLKGGH